MSCSLSALSWVEVFENWSAINVLRVDVRGVMSSISFGVLFVVVDWLFGALGVVFDVFFAVRFRVFRASFASL